MTFSTQKSKDRNWHTTFLSILESMAAAKLKMFILKGIFMQIK